MAPWRDLYVATPVVDNHMIDYVFLWIDWIDTPNESQAYKKELQKSDTLQLLHPQRNNESFIIALMFSINDIPRASPENGLDDRK